MAPPIYNINVFVILEERENFIENKIKLIKDENLSHYQKKIMVLTDSKTTKYYLENENNNYIEKKEENNKNILIFKESFVQNQDNNLAISLEGDTNSTCDNSKSFHCSQNTENIVLENQEKKLNSLRVNFALKNKLYDIVLNPNLDFPQKYNIDEKHYAFAYQNNIKTYGFTQSAFLAKENVKINNTILMNINDSKYYYNLGLYFCNKEIDIKIGNEISKKKCILNEFMCKKCMEINKKHYNIKKNYLINIYGRVAKINKGKFHCFGYFLLGTQIEQCISKFSCNACKLLDLYSKYFL